MGTSTKTRTSSSVRTDIKYPDRFNVIIMNDDFTPMEFVIHLLIEVFNKNIEEAKDITIQIHELGKGTLLSRHNGHPLNIMMEKV
jgi:ATP-dependent Clp protease adaptor protein ClpS